MSVYSPAMRQAATGSQRAAESTRWICAVLGVSKGPYLLYAGAFFDLVGRISGRIARDPARPDFDSATRKGVSIARPKFIPTDDPLEKAAIRTALAADDSAAYLGAHLRAFERFQGALEAGHARWAAVRREEAVRYARDGGAALVELSENLDELAGFLGDDWSRNWSERERKVERMKPPNLDVDTLATLFLGGLHVRNLERVLVRVRMPKEPGSAEKRFVAATKAFGDFATRMKRWTPPASFD